jgi:hypothetical protein
LRRPALAAALSLIMIEALTPEEVRRAFRVYEDDEA